MSIEVVQGKNVNIHLWAPVVEVESKAIDQLRNIAALPVVFHHVAAMPDVHLGKGATVGSVIAMKDAISPNAVGVDIGCGMAAVRTSLTASDLPESLVALRSQIEANIPVGNGPDGSRAKAARPENFAVQTEVKKLFEQWETLTVETGLKKADALNQIGTLGGGNHFIELCLDKGVCTTCEGTGSVDMRIGFEKCDDCNGGGKREPRVWLMLHSGSRGVGNLIAQLHVKTAQKLEHNLRLPDPELAYFLAGTPEMKAYRHDLFWAQEYARVNRAVMLDAYKTVLTAAFEKPITFDDGIQCHHNYVAEEVHFGEEVLVTRKGAIRARKGDMGIIPGSMGARSFIVRGKGNPEAFESASHGAGRRMSRTAAVKKFTVADLIEQTKGVECRKDQDVLDEIPGSYKDIDQVMANQADLVEIVAELKAVLCVKGGKSDHEKRRKKGADKSE